MIDVKCQHLIPDGIVSGRCLVGVRAIALHDESHLRRCKLSKDRSQFSGIYHMHGQDATSHDLLVLEDRMGMSRWLLSLACLDKLLLDLLSTLLLVLDS